MNTHKGVPQVLNIDSPVRSAGERAALVLTYLQAQEPSPKPSLHFRSAFELLVATMLSCQCTDTRINQVTPRLFLSFPTAEAMAEASEREIYEHIKSVSYPNAKAHALKQMAVALVERYAGAVPQSIRALESLRGVGRKTANVVLSQWFGQERIAVDTHVDRVSHRLGLVSAKANTPEKVEQELMKNIPPHLVANAHHWLIHFGRSTCRKRNPKCEQCPFVTLCLKNEI